MADSHDERFSEPLRERVDLHSYWNGLRQRCENLSTQLRAVWPLWSLPSRRLALIRLEDTLSQANTKAVDFFAANKAWIDRCEKGLIASGERDPDLNPLLLHAGQAFWEYHKSLEKLATVVSGQPRWSERIKEKVQQFENYFRDNNDSALSIERVFFRAQEHVPNRYPKERPLSLKPVKLLRLRATLAQKVREAQQRRPLRRELKGSDEMNARTRPDVLRERAPQTATPTTRNRRVLRRLRNERPTSPTVTALTIGPRKVLRKRRML